MEFYTVPHSRPLAGRMFRELLAASGATHIEAQTNMPVMLALLRSFACNCVEEKILFEDGYATRLRCPAGVFRQSTPKERGLDREWVIEEDGEIMATGGVLYHYNPPYGDIYMEVAETARRRGFGSYMVQELKRICYANGKIPAARCDPSNIASRRTLEKAGFLACGRLLAGEVRATASRRGIARRRRDVHPPGSDRNRRK